MTPTSLLPSLQGMHLSIALLLPVETLFHVFAQLEDPCDLYRASLVCRTWHRAAIDDRLWEDFFWQYYRPCQSGENASEEEMTLERYWERKRRAAMLSWLRIASSSPPSCDFFEHRSDIVWEAKKELDEVKTRPLPQDLSQAAAQVQVSDLAERKYHDFLLHQDPSPISSSQPLLTPPFLSAPISESEKVTRPDFRRLFASRLKVDDELLLDLRDHVSLTRNTLQSTLAIARKYGRSASHILSAVASTQRITEKDVQDFLPGVPDQESPWPRAIDIHFAAANSITTPHSTHCLALLYTAQKILGYLQRGEAIQSMKLLQDKKRSFAADNFTTLRARIEACASAVEQAMEDVALFRGAERVQLREFLDLLALFVSTDIQAQNRDPKRSDNVHRLSADEDARPEGSTRYRLARVIASLRTLGYAVAEGPDSTDIDNGFTNLALFFRCQRPTSPLTLAAIVCAVARRLGSAATISNATSCVLLVAVEDANEPAPTPISRQRRDWHRFFVDVAAEYPSGSIREVEEVERLLESAEDGAEEHTGASLEPASQQAVLARVAGEIWATTRAERRPMIRYERAGRYEEEQTVIRLRARHDPLASLRMYLDGQAGIPPSPLQAPTLASTLGHGALPSTMHYAIRAEPSRLTQDARHCVHWIYVILALCGAGWISMAAEDVASSIAANDMYAPDYDILLPIDHGREARVIAERIFFGEEDDGSEPFDYYDSLIKPILEADLKRGVGLGAAGGGDPELRKRYANSELPRTLVDRSHSSNAAVHFGIGTLITYAQGRSRGVIVGWDTRCRKNKHWIEHRGVDNFPSGGRNQPFYHCLTEYSNEVYLAQCDVKALCFAAGTSRREAITVLSEFQSLFTVPYLGRAFRTLRVVPWDDAAEGAEEKKSKGQIEEGKRKEDTRKKGEVVEREKGQAYLVPNAWMKEVWPYD